MRPFVLRLRAEAKYRCELADAVHAARIDSWADAVERIGGPGPALTLEEATLLLEFAKSLEFSRAERLGFDLLLVFLRRWEAYP